MAEKRRQTSSRLDDCPFEIYGKKMLMEIGDLLSKYQIITILIGASNESTSGQDPI